MFELFKSILSRELKVVYRRWPDYFNIWFFFILLCTLFPLAITPDTKILLHLAPGVIWISALLVVISALPNLFKSDFDNGALEHLLLSGQPFALIVLAKLCAFWLAACLPLVIIAPLIAILFHAPLSVAWVASLSLLVGSPVLVAIGGIGSALTLGLRQGGALLAVLLMPLYIPVLVFGSALVQQAMNQMPLLGLLSLLSSLLVFSLAVATPAIAFAIKLAHESA